MNLTITGHRLEVTPALREYLLTKLDRPTRHFDQIVSVDILLKVENRTEKEHRQTVVVTVCVKGKSIVVKKSNEDLYAAIDEAMDCLDRQVIAYKTKIQDHRHVAPKRALAATA